MGFFPSFDGCSKQDGILTLHSFLVSVSLRLKLIQLGGVMALALPMAEYSQQVDLPLVYGG